jgi:hypothetical protein
MTGTQKAFQWLVWIIVLAVGVQFLLAGAGVLAGEDIEPHQALGSLLTLLGLILLVLAFASNQDRSLRMMSVVLFVLFILQSVWVVISDTSIIRSLHVFGAFLIVGLLTHMATKAGMPFRSEAGLK